MADKLNMGGFEQIYQYLQNAMPQTPYPESMTQDEFMSLYNNFRNGMGMDDATLKANLEAAMRPGYDQSIAALDRARREGNAEIDVDAASRGMGDSTWVTDAKLRNLRNTENNIADLNANYNATLYNQLLNAMQNRDANALNNAWNWAQMQNQNDLNKWNAQNAAQQNAFSNAWSYWMNQQNKKNGGGKSSKTPSINYDVPSYEQYLSAISGAGNAVNNVIGSFENAFMPGQQNKNTPHRSGLVRGGNMPITKE